MKNIVQQILDLLVEVDLSKAARKTVLAVSRVDIPSAGSDATLITITFRKLLLLTFINTYI